MYRLRRIDFDTEEQRGPDYLAINPKGRVPALVAARGVLTETPAMLAYIAQSYPAAELAPLDDPFAFGQIHQSDFFEAQNGPAGAFEQRITVLNNSLSGSRL